MAQHLEKLSKRLVDKFFKKSPESKPPKSNQSMNLLI